MEAHNDDHEFDTPADKYVDRLHKENEMLVGMVKSLLAQVEDYEAKLAEGKQQIDELQEMVKE